MDEVLPAVLGWSNPETAGGANVRLYALDRGASPRWDSGGRTVEKAIIESDGGFYEGDLYLIVPVGTRFNSEKQAALKVDIERILDEHRE
jgi:hypothetical protein